MNTIGLRDYAIISKKDVKTACIHTHTHNNVKAREEIKSSLSKSFERSLVTFVWPVSGPGSLLCLPEIGILVTFHSSLHCISFFQESSSS